MTTEAPTFAEIWTQLGYVIELRNNLDLALNSSPNLISDKADVKQNVGKGLYVADAHSAAEDVIAIAADPLTESSLREAIRPFLREFMNLITGKEPRTSISDQEMIAVLREYMVDNSKTIKTRSLTINAPTVTTATGDFTVRRLSTDKDANTIESVSVETLTFECEADQNSGTKEYAERFRVTGASAYSSAAQWTGSGLSRTLIAAHARTTSILKNPSFDKNDGTDNTAFSTTTSCTDWTVATAANWKFRSSAVDSSYIYRGYPGAQATKWSIENTASDSITQVIKDVNTGATFRRDVPYFLRVAVQRKSSATGTLTLDFGASSANVDISTLTNDQWAHLFIALTEDSWFDNFNQDALDVVLTTTSLAVGTIVLDDTVLAPMTMISGSYYIIDGGDTPALVGDKWTSTTSEGTRGKNGYWFWRAYGDQGWLPAAATPTEADPT